MMEIVVFTLLFFLMAGIQMFAWNTVVPKILELPMINYSESCAILLLMNAWRVLRVEKK